MRRLAFDVRKLVCAWAAAVVVLAVAASQALAQGKPGEGVVVHPIKVSYDTGWLEHMVVQRGLEALGYEVAEHAEADYPLAFLAVGEGSADYYAEDWGILHKPFYERAGGDRTMFRVGPIVSGVSQGFFIDKKTADAYGIVNLGQLKDPNLARLFDIDGDGRANLSGCNPGWGCELVIERHLDDFGLRDFVQHDQGGYTAIMAGTVARYREGRPILYYSWFPSWVGAVLVSGRDVVQIAVPSSRDGKTVGQDGFDSGFPIDNEYISVNKEFAEKNPSAAKFLELVHIPLLDVNESHLRIHEGYDEPSDILRHADEWITANREQFDAWVAEAAAVR